MANDATSPEHYKQGGLQVIDILKAKLTTEQYKGFLKGNILKYIFRGDYKNHLEDYKKAAVYLQWLIEQEAESENSKHLPN